MMRLAARLDQFEIRPELCCKAGAVMALHRQAAAFLRTIGSKRRNDDLAARRNRRSQPLDIGVPVALVDQEVKRRAVVPYVVSPGRPPNRGVGDDPVDRGRGLT